MHGHMNVKNKKIKIKYIIHYVSASAQNFRKRTRKFSVLETVQPDSVVHTA